MISIYADGSSTGRSNKPGGWSYVIVKDGQELTRGHGGDPKTTNNRMELQGAIEGLKAYQHFLHIPIIGEPRKLELVSDSQYTLGIADGKFRIKKNVDLATELRRLMIATHASTRWVKGHSKDTFNEECDALAKSGKVESGTLHDRIKESEEESVHFAQALQAVDGLIQLSEQIKQRGPQRLLLANNLVLFISVEDGATK